MLLLCSIVCVIGGLVMAISDGDASGEHKEGRTLALDGILYVLAAVNAGQFVILVRVRTHTLCVDVLILRTLLCKLLAVCTDHNPSRRWHSVGPL